MVWFWYWKHVILTLQSEIRLNVLLPFLFILSCVTFCLILSPAFFLWITSERVTRKSEKMENLPPPKRWLAPLKNQVFASQAQSLTVEMSGCGSRRVEGGCVSADERLNRSSVFLLKFTWLFAAEPGFELKSAVCKSHSLSITPCHLWKCWRICFLSQKLTHLSGCL